MGGILGEILAPCQFGFIPGRRIHTCVALASDAINHLDAGTKGKMSLKVDISKDFNTSFFSMCYDVCNFPIVLYRWSEVYFPLPVSLCLLMVHHMGNFLVLEGSVRGNRSLPSFFFFFFWLRRLLQGGLTTATGLVFFRFTVVFRDTYFMRMISLFF